MKIRVIYVVSGSKMYGATKAIMNIIDGVVACGVTPFVVTPYKGDICNELEKRKIEYKVFRYYFSIYPKLSSFFDILLFIPRFLRFFLYNKIAVKKLSNVVKEFKPNIIHTNVGPINIGFIVAKRLNIKHVWHIREYQDLDFGWCPFPSKLSFINNLNSLSTSNIAISYDIFNHFNLQKNTQVIYDGVMKKEQIKIIVNKKKYFLFVGRLEDAKNIRLLIEVFIDFCKWNADFELLIVGDGNPTYVSTLYQIVDQSKLTERIRFLGFRTDVYNLMANSIALIVPSRHEGFGFITVEAMYNGCLVIGNNTGGTKEILEKENLGLLYSGRNELLEHMKNVVLNGIESYYPTIEKSQKKASELYSIEQNFTSVYNYYKEILGKK
jgi:L-malate glycosyltransferase